MRTFEKKKLYKGLIELRDYEIENAIKENESVKLIYDGQFMILTPTKLKKEKIFINTQKSIINDGQTYHIYGFRWKPTSRLDEQVEINFDTRTKLSEIWKEVKKQKGL
jgi:hypothetical protein